MSTVYFAMLQLVGSFPSVLHLFMKTKSSKLVLSKLESQTNGGSGVGSGWKSFITLRKVIKLVDVIEVDSIYHGR